MIRKNVEWWGTRCILACNIVLFLCQFLALKIDKKIAKGLKT